MGMLAGIFSGFTRKNQKNTDSRADCIFYKIVDSTGADGFILQCLNTKAVFRASLHEIVFDIDILYGLHPIQACFIGINYSTHLRESYAENAIKSQQQEKFTKYATHRYGNYRITSQNREGELYFMDIRDNLVHAMDPRDIALSEDLIEEFDATQAFYIGLSAGLKMNNPVRKNNNNNQKARRPHLRIVK